MPPSSYCSRTIYHGHVQGVGFRWTTQRIARRHPVRGFVRNCPDGTVELVACGVKADVDAFLEDLAESMRRYIQQSDTQPHSPNEELQGFEIRH